MLARLLALLRQPYPVLEAPGAQLRRAALIGLFVGGFLLIFQPFDLGQWRTPYKGVKIAGFGLITFGATLVHFILWPRLWPAAFREQRWTVGRALLYLNLNVLLIALANHLYLGALLPLPFRASGLFWMLGATFLIGLFPSAATVTATYVRQLRRYQAAAAELPTPHMVPEPVLTETPPPATITFTADNGKDTLTLPAADVLYLESDGNYCTVVAQPAGTPQPTRTLLRSALSRLAQQAEAQHPGHLSRVHRSYLVALARVGRVSGNAQGYRLHFAPPAQELEPVPVARSYAEGVLAALRAPARAGAEHP